MEGKIKTGIYIIQNLENKKSYIGQSTQIEKRLSDHLYLLNSNKHYNISLQRAWKKYGKDSFFLGLLCECKEEELDEKEKYYISQKRTYKKGYNFTEGGKKTNNKKQQKRNCKICGKITTFKFPYCEEHRYKCPVCKERHSIKKERCEKCKNALLDNFCAICGIRFTKNSNRQKYCKECFKINERQMGAERTRRYREKN